MPKLALNRLWVGCALHDAEAFAATLQNVTFFAEVPDATSREWSHCYCLSCCCSIVLFPLDILSCRHFPSPRTLSFGFPHHFPSSFGCGQSGESYRPLTLIVLKNIAIHLPFFIAIVLQEHASFKQKELCTPPICTTIWFPFVSRYFCKSMKVRSRLNTPK